MRLKGISEATGPCRQVVRNAIDLCGRHGVKGLSPGRRGRPSGKGRRLAEEQERQIQKDIRDKWPEQLKMDFALWTCEAVLAYIREHFGIEMSIRTVGEYLKRRGYTPQKPIKVAYEQKPEAARQWLDQTYSESARRAKEEGAEIHWVGETVVMNTDVCSRSHAPRGQTPTTRTSWGSRQRFSMVSSVNNQEKCGSSVGVCTIGLKSLHQAERRQHMDLFDNDVSCDVMKFPEIRR